MPSPGPRWSSPTAWCPTPGNRWRGPHNRKATSACSPRRFCIWPCSASASKNRCSTKSTATPCTFSTRPSCAISPKPSPACTAKPILKNALDYADRLAVHVNHLNRSVKEVTGKSTTAHLAERFVSEAKVLLQHSDWSVGEIADRLGFEYATYFNSFFKKHTGTTPLAFRKTAR
nr:helix-turn-helix domain-containing protein [Hymenobacter negativus]